MQNSKHIQHIDRTVYHPKNVGKGGLTNEGQSKILSLQLYRADLDNYMCRSIFTSISNSSKRQNWRLCLAGGPYTINNLQSATTYAIRVASRNEAGYGDFSPSITEVTNASPVTTKNNPHSSSQPLAMELLLCALVMAALLAL